MEQQVANGDNEGLMPLVEQRQHVPYRNGVSNLFLHPTEEINKNHPTVKDNILTRTVESVILGLEREQTAKQEQGQELESPERHRTVIPDHASQLLKAAASVVSNNFKTMYSKEDVSSSNVVITTGLSQSTQDGINTTTNGRSISQLHSTMTRNGSCSTTVSFSSKPTMSTGFNVHTSSTGSQLTGSSLLTVSSLDTIPSVDKSPSLYDPSKEITVPFLWRRVCEEGTIVYYSPTGNKLDCLASIKKYLLSEDTCKCGLTCPFHVEKVFNFDPTYHSKEWKLDDIDNLNEPTSVSCCHRKHVRSHALAQQCKNNTKLSKPSPAKRKAKPASAKRPSVKSPTLSRSHITDGAMFDHTDNKSVSFVPPHTKVIVSPLPPVEVVASQLRGSRSLEVMPPAFSPNHMNPGLSPRLLSPGHDPMIAVGYHGMPGGPPIPGRMMPNHQGYPMNKMMPYPVHRHPSDPGVRMQPPPGYFPPYVNPHGFPVGVAHPYHNQQGYDYVQGHHPHWGTHPHPMPPPQGTQFGPPMWQAKTETKRKRRASSKSSTAGSDVALGSPALASPGPNKEKRELSNKQPDNSTTESIESAIPVNITQQSSTVSQCATTATNTTSKPGNDKTTANTTESKDLATDKLTDFKSDSNKPQGDNSSKTVPQPTGSSRMLVRGANPFEMHNNVPIGAYMEPIYMPRQNPPNFRPQPAQMMYHNQQPFYSNQPGFNYPRGYAQQFAPRPMVQQPSTLLQPTALSSSELSKKSDLERLSSDGREDSTDVTSDEGSVKKGDNKESKTKLPGISTIAAGSGHGLSKLPSINGIRSEYPLPGYQPHHIPPREVIRGPHPSQVMQAPNGQMFYRYYEPHLPSNQHPMSMYYPPSSHPMYHQPSASAHIPPGYQYNPQTSPSTSPKRKRRKALTKTSIESHSAVLVGTSDAGLDDAKSVAATNGQISDTNSESQKDNKSPSETVETTMQSNT